VAGERAPAAEEEVAALVARLRAEVRAGGGGSSTPDVGVSVAPLVARQEADELRAVSSDRAFLVRPGRWGRIRGALLVPAKIVLKKMMRWYVEPAFSDQRTFNAAVLRVVDELHSKTAADVPVLKERLARLEEGAERDRSDR
jgi:hypothetical protein